MEIQIVPMGERHIAALAELEQLCFSAPRSETVLRNELHNPTIFLWRNIEIKEETCKRQAMQECK